MGEVVYLYKPVYKKKKVNREFKTPCSVYCQYCGRTDLPIQRHHIIYRSQGGLGNEKNRIDLCSSCNKLAHEKADGFRAKDLYYKAYIDRKRRRRISELLSD